MPGCFLWISALHWIWSSWLCCRTSSPICTCLTPPAGWSVTSCLIGGHWWVKQVKLGKHVSDSQTISTGSPQVCVLSPLLFSLYSNNCTSIHQSVKLLKFIDDTTLIRLIFLEDESAYRWETIWCRQNKLELNTLKTMEMLVDFRKDPAPRNPITLCDYPVNTAEHCCFLGTIITQDLK